MGSSLYLALRFSSDWRGPNYSLNCGPDAILNKDCTVARVKVNQRVSIKEGVCFICSAC